MNIRIVLSIILICVWIIPAYVAFKKLKSAHADRTSFAYATASFAIFLALSAGMIFVAYTFEIRALTYAAPALTVPLMTKLDRGGKSRDILIAYLCLLFIVESALLFVGLPTKAPVLTVDGTEIRVLNTSLSSLHEEGFDVYVRSGDADIYEYSDLLTGDVFQPYAFDEHIEIPAAQILYTDALVYMDYLLVKDGVVIGGILPYGSNNKSMKLEDCTILRFVADEESLAAMNEKGIAIDVDGVSLQSTLDTALFEQTYGTSIWNKPEPSEASGFYGVMRERINGNIYWHSYAILLNLNDEGAVKNIEINGTARV